MQKIFDQNNVFWIKEKLNWKDVIKLGVQKLVDKGQATEKLETAILESTKQYGAYYVLEKGIALLHAAPGNYSLKPAVSTLILSEAVTFNDQADKTARIIITLSTPDSDSHMGFIQDFAMYFMDKNFKQEILTVQNLEQFWTVVNKYKGD
ncbi:PTS sugar transporter subunit IIA [Mycoplasma iguanae]|uniref:Ascorbate-specific PTS system EIIA component n=1 Tax=Mycoplasma iguanae TaxID=292461 RepID=A0ABY5RB36_9MOLU|nr:PTS sugar transporter subunit IIA [Mycoplasma iguanae]UVD81825.1 PTS sugar transporter subunit IIA [Mycoplasma iguanae]